MSVLNAIKGRIVTVQQDLTNSFHLPFLSSKQDISNKQSAVSDNSFNADAGAELLSVYQRNWSEIHRLSDENAGKAQELDNIVTSIFLKLDRENTAVNEFLLESQLLPKVVEQLSELGELVSTLEGSFKELESMLVQLEDISDEMQQKKNIVEHEYQLTKYQQRKNIELEQSKVELARKHASKAREYEEHLNRTLRERQKVFEDTFREQMLNYKRLGKLDPSVHSSTATTDQLTDLGDIAIEDDASQLDSFLNANDSTDATNTSNAVPSAISSSSTAAPSAGEMDESQASNGNETVIFNAVTDSDKTDDVHCDSVNVVDDDVNNESLRQPVHDAAPCTEANDPTLTTLSSADEKN